MNLIATDYDRHSLEKQSWNKKNSGTNYALNNRKKMSIRYSQNPESFFWMQTYSKFGEELVLNWCRLNQ